MVAVLASQWCADARARRRGGAAAVMVRCTHYPPGGAALAALISCSGGLRSNMKVTRDDAAPAATAMPNAWVVEAMVSRYSSSSSASFRCIKMLELEMSDSRSDRDPPHFENKG